MSHESCSGKQRLHWYMKKSVVASTMSLQRFWISQCRFVLGSGPYQRLIHG